MNNSLRHSVGRLSVVASVMAVALLVGFIVGCSTLGGTQDDNQKPIVQFVNIPPEAIFDTTSTDPLIVDTVRGYTRFSRNPFIHWYGTDVDGQIDFYRYVVITSDDMGGSAPLDYIQTNGLLDESGPTYDTTLFETLSLETLSLQPFEVEATVDKIIDSSKSKWKYLDVSASAADPRTTEIVSLRAFNDDPVNQYLLQYVFVQAFDEEGLGSDIRYRGFERNDSPPQTKLLGPDTLFINSVDTGIITGVSMRWTADDPDYPGSGEDIPLFNYQWRLYGPYDDASFVNLKAKHFRQAFFTSDAKRYMPGETVIACATAPDGTIDSCDTVVLVEGVNPGGLITGGWETFLNVDVDTSVIGVDTTISGLGLDPFLNRIADRSDSSSADNQITPDRWTHDSTVTLFDVYRNDGIWYDRTGASDTTVQMHYVFWVKSRDDANVEDLTPAFRLVSVINPRFERAVMVATVTFEQINPPASGQVVRDTWSRVVNSWGQSNVPGWNNESFIVEPTDGGPHAIDFHQGGPPLSKLLKHKVVILFSDDVIPPDSKNFDNVFKSIDAGANVWACMRTPIIGGSGQSVPQFGERVSGQYAFYFGVKELNYSSWWSFLPKLNGGIRDARIESFVGAYSLMEGLPDLSIDTALLHANYKWPEALSAGWDPDVAALPEVDWMSSNSRAVGGVRRDVEGMFLFKSKYGQGGAAVGIEGLKEYDGSPVAHRVTASYFKTANFLFTPLAFEQTTFQVVSDSVLNFLYEPELAAPITNKPRYNVGGN